MKIILNINLHFNNHLYIFICMQYNKVVINVKKIIIQFYFKNLILLHVLKVNI